MIRESGWRGRVVTTYRPDSVVDPHFPGFRENIGELGAITGEDAATWTGYLAAHRKRRALFKSHGATASDHGHPSAATADLAPGEAAALLSRVLAEAPSDADAELFRAQMLTEMAAMSLDDGLVMQIHPGSWRNHNPSVHRQFGRDKGADIPTTTRLRAGAEGAARSLRQREAADDHPVHARRDRLFTRTRAARRPLS